MIFFKFHFIVIFWFILIQMAFLVDFLLIYFKFKWYLVLFDDVLFIDWNVVSRMDLNWM